MKIKSIHRRMAAFLLMFVLLLCGCGAESSAAKAPSTETKNGSFEIPAFEDAHFNEETAVDYGSVQLDASSVSRGYVAVRAERDSRMKFQIICGEGKYNYDISNGETAILPLNMGSGTYTLRLMEQISGTKYACGWSGEIDVQLEDEYQPFLHQSQIVPYEEDSDCVKKAHELAAACDTDTDMASAVYGYLVKNVKYDKKKAETVETGYLPVPDDTLHSGKGICFDYAALAAAMMRSVGIPCKLITGYVNDGLYHAWNSFYLKDQGWVTVEIKAPGNSWKRVDITFAASGTPADKLQDDELYTTRYVY